MNKHFLVVGAGISGVSVTEHLLRAGQKVTLLDQENNRCSHIAAGIINPIGFRRMTKSWRADEFLENALQFYISIEQKTKSSFFKKLEMRRMFSSDQERQLWKEKQGDPEFSAHLTGITPSDMSYKGAKNPFGSGRLKQAYAVDPNVFFTSYQQWFTKENKWLNESFDFDKFNPSESTYHHLFYDGVIFCQGGQNPDNPLFRNVPVQTTKGELLIVQSDYLQPKETLNRKCFVLPLEGNKFKIGATYEWETRDCSPSPQGKEKLLNAYSHLSDEPIEVVAQLAGTRPTTLDRRPYIGRHKEFSRVYLFNGLGSKGYLLAPLLAKEFTEFILNDKPLSKEIYPYRHEQKPQVQ
jgi:glycine oxidase